MAARRTGTRPTEACCSGKSNMLLMIRLSFMFVDHDATDEVPADCGAGGFCP